MPAVAKWRKSVHKMRHDWGLKAKPGWKIFIANRGQLRFDIPGDWVIGHEENAIRFTDKEPPDDDCAMRLTVWSFPRGVDWSDLPLEKLLLDGKRDKLEQYGLPVARRCPGGELLWAEFRWNDDTQENRPAVTRQCVARGPDGTALLTMDLWRDDYDRFAPIWENVVGTIQFELKINAPPPTTRKIVRGAN